jgi:hypothetical protein
MPEPIPASGTVHWVGAGLSTGSGLRALCELADRVVLWSRTKRRAEDKLAVLGLRGHAHARSFGIDALAAAVGRGDVVVSMLPAGMHGTLLQLCTEHGAHFACSSYVSPSILTAAGDADHAGLVVLTEAGLDPGIDHLLAHVLVAEGQEAVGEAPVTASLTSFCGGIPAVPNAFRYRFSWAPRGVLSALREPARYVAEGSPRSVRYPWEATDRMTVNGEEFEVYPNRDSLPFISQYRIPSTWKLETFVRGTLRLAGWHDAWAHVFAELRQRPERIDALADELAARYRATDADLDRVVLTVELELSAHGTPAWSGGYRLDTTGDQLESAMARCVSLPLSFGVGEILAGRMASGLHRAAGDADEARRWIAFLTRHGVTPASLAARTAAGGSRPSRSP